ncbi:NAD(P)H-dependent flavin oxidoreductase, partial [Thermodesulfobacteriota bacterium]
CGGHPSMEGVTTLVLIPQAIDAVKAPLIAGGGFSDGRSLVAALALGADGVNMGTRFMSTKECTIHQAVKERIVESPETCTVIVQQSIGNPSRVYRNPWAEKVLDLEDKGATLEELTPYITGERGRKIYETGNIEEGLLPLGQVVGRIRDIPTVAELMDKIVNEAVEVKQRLDQVL